MSIPSILTATPFRASSEVKELLEAVDNFLYFEPLLGPPLLSERG